MTTTKRKDDNEKLFQEELNKYAEKYDIGSLTNPNDEANLHMMIRNQIEIQTLQNQVSQLIREDAAANVQVIVKLKDIIESFKGTNMQIEKLLGIDRKTRKNESEQSVSDYWNKLKQHAEEFLRDEDKLLRVYCKHCKIMVGRISGVYDTTSYFADFQCPQCKKRCTVKREEKDVFFDLKAGDKEWRRKYPIEIVHPVQPKDSIDTSMIQEDNEIVIDYDENESESNDQSN